MQVEFPGLGISLFVDPTAFTIGSFSVQWYAVFIVMSFLIGTGYAMLNGKNYGLDKGDIFDVSLTGIMCGMVGARLYYVAFKWDMFKDDPIRIITDIRSGGLAIYGGIIAAIIGGIIVARIKKVSIASLLDLAAMGLLFSHGLGRWGNFTNQEAFGSVTNLPWGMMSENTNYLTVHPCFLYESLWSLLGFALMHFFIRKKIKYKGQVFIFYIMWYGFARTFIEGLRTDSLYLPFTLFGLPLRVSQILSICMVIGGAIALIAFRKRNDFHLAVNNNTEGDDVNGKD